MEETDRIIPIRIRKEVRARERNKCRKCTSKERLQFHHIIPFYEIKINSRYREIVHKRENLILLCKKCHDDAPNDPLDFFSWICKGMNLPPTFSKCISLIEMGLPILILHKESRDEKGYLLSVSNGDWIELVDDFKNFLVDFWEIQLASRNAPKDEQVGIIGKYIEKTMSKVDTNTLKEKTSKKFYKKHNAIKENPNKLQQ